MAKSKNDRRFVSDAERRAQISAKKHRAARLAAYCDCGARLGAHEIDQCYACQRSSAA